MNARLLVPPLAAAALAGCGGGRGPTRWAPEQSWTSPHFVYHARPDDGTVTGAAPEALEQDAALVAGDFLRLAPGAWGPIDYFKHRSLADLTASGSPCGDRACTVRFESGRVEVHSPNAVDHHELVHAYDDRLACAPPLLREGLAVSVSCDPATEPTVVRPTDRPSWVQRSWRQLGGFDAADTRAYEPAGALVTFIIDRWGADRFLHFYRSLPCRPGDDALDAAFLADLGVSLDQLWAELVASPRRRACLFLSGCAEEERAGALTLTNRAEGHHLGVPIPAGGAMVRAAYLPPSQPPVVRPCTAAGALPGLHGYWPLEPAAWAPVILLPGADRNTVALRDTQGTRDDPNVTLGLTLEALPAAGASCADVTPLPIEGDRATVILWPRPGSVLLAPRSTVAAPSQTAGLRHDGGGEAAFEVCAACVDGVLQGCVNAEPGSELHAPWLRVRWAPALFAPLTLSIEWL